MKTSAPGRVRLGVCLVALTGLVLAGCTTVLLPSSRDGRCYTAKHAWVIGTTIALANAIDGWRCEGLQAGLERRRQATVRSVAVGNEGVVSLTA